MHHYKWFAPLPFLLILTGLCVMCSLLIPASARLLSWAGMGLAAILLSILIHESGHLLAGSAAGLSPQELIAGPARLVFAGRSSRVYVNRSWLHFGGITRFAPNSADLESLARQWSWMALGGPAASFMTFLLLLLSPWPLPLWLLMLMWISLGMFVATALPGNSGIGLSDGKMFLQLRANSAQTQIMMSSILLQKDYLSRRRPKDWNREIIGAAAHRLEAVPESESTLAEQMELRLYLYYYYMDTGLPDSALAYIEPVALSAHQAKRVPAVRNMIGSFYASRLLIHASCDEERLHKAEQLVKSLSRQEPYSYNLAWSSLLAVQGRREEAQAHLDKARGLLERWFSPFGIYIVERELLCTIEQMISGNEK